MTMTVSTFQKKPVRVEAVQVDTQDYDGLCEIVGWCGGRAVGDFDEGGDPDAVIAIETLEGTMTAKDGDYIIKGVQGEFYPCKPDIFEQTYEKVD